MYPVIVFLHDGDSVVVSTCACTVAYGGQSKACAVMRTNHDIQCVLCVHVHLHVCCIQFGQKSGFLTVPATSINGV